jgi:hypothetical protein
MPARPRRLLATLGLFAASAAMVAASTSAASAATATTAPGHTIATAGTLTIGNTANGGGGPADFWKVALSGGDIVQFSVTTPDTSTYAFELFTPGTSDANFPSAVSFSSSTTNYSGKTVFDLQAPYNGTFILAVCQGPNVVGFNCPGYVSDGQADNPMSSYSFSTSFATKVSSTVASKETKASPAIASAPTISVGNFESGGAGQADFWKISLRGGDVVQFSVSTLYGSTYAFELYPPGTNSTGFPAAVSFSSSTTNYNGHTVFDLQAPYNGTFILAVCQGPNVVGFNCPGYVSDGQADNPMSPYTFSTSFSKEISAGVAAKETRSSPTIAHAPKTGIGNFEAGGATPIDYWRVSLNGGDVVQFSATTPYGSTYAFGLFKGSTTDTSFPAATAVSSATTNYNGHSVFTLNVPRTGSYLLAVCQGPNVVGFNCPGYVSDAQAYNPMSPYTFSLNQTGGRETKTSLKLSASTVTVGHEKSLVLSVAVKAVYGGHPTGTAAVSDGKKRICTVKLVNGKGSCSPSGNSVIAAGSYTVTAYYSGNLLGSQSGGSALKVKK